MTPTAEQLACIEAFNTKQRLRISAYAGTGKTSTLKLLASQASSGFDIRSGVYLAFNKSIAEEAKTKFPSTVDCRTQHSLALSSLGKTFSRDKYFGSFNGNFIVARFKIQGEKLSDDFSVTPAQMGQLIVGTLKSFMSSADSMIHRGHVPSFPKLSEFRRESERNRSIVRDFKDIVTNYAIDIWARHMTNPKSNFPLGHDGYLKVWALGNPQIKADYILLDEAQDTNGVILGVMENQKSAQLIAVGDAHQQIYEWRGAVNAMTELPCDLEARLATSFRFGSNIADYANRILSLLGETVPLVGNPDVADKVGDLTNPDAILARTNARLLTMALDRIDAGQQIYIVGGTGELEVYVRAIEKLKAGTPVENPIEFFGYKNWNEVVEASEKEDAGDIRRWVNLVNNHGTETLRRLIRSVATDASDAQVIFSTGHKAKGCEWNKVRLCDDFLRGVDANREEPYEPSKIAEELRLFYVAATRAKRQLEVPGILEAKLANVRR